MDGSVCPNVLMYVFIANNFDKANRKAHKAQQQTNLATEVSDAEPVGPRNRKLVVMFTH
jgi:hypothetical protein